MNGVYVSDSFLHADRHSLHDGSIANGRVSEPAAKRSFLSWWNNTLTVYAPPSRFTLAPFSTLMIDKLAERKTWVELRLFTLCDIEWCYCGVEKRRGKGAGYRSKVCKAIIFHIIKGLCQTPSVCFGFLLTVVFQSSRWPRCQISYQQVMQRRWTTSRTGDGKQQ